MSDNILISVRRDELTSRDATIADQQAEIDRLRSVVQRCGICRDATHAPPFESVDAELTRAYCRMNQAAELLEQSQATVVDSGRCGAVVVLRSALAVRTTKGLK